MKAMITMKRIHLIAIAAVAVCALPVAVQAQSAKAQIDTPKFDAIPSPDINTGYSKSFKPKDWLEIEAKINIEMKPEPKSGFCDSITVRWFIAVKNPAGQRGLYRLSKNINYVNIPLGEDVYVSAYLSPNTIKRLTGSWRAGRGVVDYVGLEILYNGVKIGEATNKGKVGWWNSPKLSQTDKYPLLSKDETPFRDLWYDRYAEIQKQRM